MQTIWSVIFDYLGIIYLFYFEREVKSIMKPTEETTGFGHQKAPCFIRKKRVKKGPSNSQFWFLDSLMRTVLNVGGSSREPLPRVVINPLVKLSIATLSGKNHPDIFQCSEVFAGIFPNIGKSKTLFHRRTDHSLLKQIP